MKDEEKSAEQLIQELRSCRDHLSLLEKAETENKRAEEALRESEERWRRIFDYFNEAVFVIDAKRDRILEVNPKACEMLGYTYEELLSQKISSIHPDEMPQLLAFAESIFKQGGGRTDELTCLTKSGTKLPAEISASVIEVDGRRCLIALVRDISERKRAEQALRESEARFRRLVEHASDALFLIEPDGKIITVNEQACQNLGYSRQELLKMYLWDFSIAANPERLMTIWAEMKPDVPVTLEGIHKRKDESTFPVEVRACKLKYEGRDLFLALARDSTERKRVEEDRQKLVALIENSPNLIGFGTMDRPPKPLYVNPAGLKMLGFDTLEEAIAHNVVDFHPEDEQQRYLQVIVPALLEKGHWEGETCIRNFKTGERIPIHRHLFTVNDPHTGKPIITASIIHDISALKQAEQALRESEERYRTLYNHTPVMMHSINRAGKLISVNDYWLKTLGYEYDEVIGQKVFEFYTKESARYAHDIAFKEFLGKGFIKDKEIQVVKKNGEVIDVLLSAVGKWNEQGELLYSMAFLVDITERKRAEEERLKLATLVEKSYDLIGFASLEGEVLYLNEAGLKLVGFHSLSEARSKAIIDLHPEEQKTQIRELIQPTVRQKGHWEGELLVKHLQTGALIPTHFNIFTLRHPQTNECYANAVIVRDITKLKQAEATLRESEERLSRILESAMDAIITIDDRQRIVLFNQAAEKVFGCFAAEILHQPLDQFLTDSFRNILVSYLSDSSKRKRSASYMWTPEGLTARRADSEEFPIEATISEVTVSGQKLFTIILRDINERLKAEAELSKLQMQNIFLQEEIKSEYNFGEIIGASAGIKKVFKNIEKVAGTDTTVLLTGETGTGKELIARAIHNLSTRKNSVLINVNSGALPSGLVESELFGHEKGAFTGATTRKKGRFELADGGSLFLDEVGELPLDTQTKLLRVLQEQEFERVGGMETIKVDVRVIAATNRKLEEAVKLGVFRADLFYRLNIFPIHIPPLRERLEDIPLLTSYFIRKFSRRIGKRIESLNPQVMERLRSYHWPGNVRELANILERAVILCEGGVLKENHIVISTPSPISEPEINSLEEAERQHILRALEKTGGVLGGPTGAAKLLDVNRSTLWSKMKKLGIN
ncbi:PAS domain S-box protein [candidate division KSB1 bacterium]|nr:PAS domain S-box protein [candidate division KSB1 bacterium]NIV69638.1 PAS domain S-box protein [Phycisphaerae bacterium]NIR70377.1 PAS domain S-box protein [candidate division KSB1 bacterium]NIS24501.1 PAS domain S-box protein [candidate division KSB1 bacterium]NIT71429.1 PAS domain S-box protein [candidate division KSB1 bacterium]